MATQVQFRRGTTAQNAAFTGVEGEVTYDIQSKRLLTHDGSTVGGTLLAKLSEVELLANKSTDGTLAANSDTLYPSQKAVKTYADTKQTALGFTPENVANKSTDGTFAANSDTLYPSQKAVKTYIASSVGPYVLKAGDTMTGTLVMTPSAANTAVLTSSGQSVTGTNATALFDLATTWTTTDAPSVIKINLTTVTNSGAFLRFQSSAVNRFILTGKGSITITPEDNITGLNVETNTTGAVGMHSQRIDSVWNTTGRCQALKISLFDTASDANSAYIECEEGGIPVTKFRIRKGGVVTIGIWNGTAVAETFGGTNQTSYILGDTLYSSAANTLSKLPGNITAAKQFLTQTGTGAVSAAPVWAAIVAGDLPGSFSGFANPSGLIGLTAVNGVATTGTRSDATHAIDQAIVPTWTGLHTFSPAANTNGVNITGFSLTGANAQTLLNMSGTVNTSGVFSAIKLNLATGTGGAGSLLLDLQVASAAKATIDLAGKLILASGATLGAALSTKVVALTDQATLATDAALGNHYRVTLGGNRTLGNPTNAYDGARIVYEFIQDGTGTRTITLDTNFALGTDITAVTLTTTASKRDFLTVIYNSTAVKWYVVAFIKGY